MYYLLFNPLKTEDSDGRERLIIQTQKNVKERRGRELIGTIRFSQNVEERGKKTAPGF